MTTRGEVKSAIREVEKNNGPISYLDNRPARVTREELRVLIEAAKKAQYSEWTSYHYIRATSDCQFVL